MNDVVDLFPSSQDEEDELDESGYFEEVISSDLLRAVINEFIDRGVLAEDEIDIVFEKLGPNTSLIDNFQALANALHLNISDIVKIGQEKIEHDTLVDQDDTVRDAERSGKLTRLRR